MAGGNGVQFGSSSAPLSPGGVSHGCSERSSSDTKTNRIALAVFISLASYLLLPKNLAVVVTASAILWACGSSSDPEISPPRRQYPPEDLSSSSGSNIGIVILNSSPLTPRTSVSSSSVLLTDSSTLQTPPTGSQLHPNQESQFGSGDSNHYPVGGAANRGVNSTFSSVFSSSSPSSYSNPPLGSQRHPNEAEPSPYTNDSHFRVGGGASQKRRSTFHQEIKSPSSSFSSSLYSPSPSPSSSYSSSFGSLSLSQNASNFGVGSGSSSPSSFSSHSYGSFAPAGSQAHPGRKESNSAGHFAVGES